MLRHQPASPFHHDSYLGLSIRNVVLMGLTGLFVNIVLVFAGRTLLSLGQARGCKQGSLWAVFDLQKYFMSFSVCFLKTLFYLSTFKSEGILHKLKKKNQISSFLKICKFWQHRLHTQGESLGRKLSFRCDTHSWVPLSHIQISLTPALAFKQY